MEGIADFQGVLESRIQPKGMAALIGDRKFREADFVLLGESTHGTHEFYQTRSEISRELITNHGYKTLIFEADWPDMYRVNAYVQGYSEDCSAAEALTDFKRFPTWMWRNEEFCELIDWVHDYNQGLPPAERVAIYGMDLYSMQRSISVVIDHIKEHYPDLEFTARTYYGCFDHRTLDPQIYGEAAWLGDRKSCEEEAVKMLLDIQKRRQTKVLRVPHPDEEEFSLEQNARVVANSEAYYRAMFRPAYVSWNIRDRHMLESVDAIAEFREKLTGTRRSVFWAHNSHMGDARASEMSEQGEVNFGQLMRERFGEKVFTLGFTTSTGTVVAARKWGGSAHVRKIKAPLDGSIEHVLSSLQEPEFVLLLNGSELQEAWPSQRFLTRAIGVIYRPETERWSHYFYANLPKQFDAIWHIEETKAVQSLDALDLQGRSPEMESYPSGL